MVSISSLSSGDGNPYEIEKGRGTWMAQLVKCLTLDFGSSHDLTVCDIEPRVGLCVAISTWDSLSPSLSLPHPRPLKINK